MPQDRNSLLASAFRDTPLVLGGRQLRRPTAGSIDLLMQTGNPLFVADEQADPEGDIDEAAAFRGIFEFAWLHTVELEEIDRLPLDPDALRDEIHRRGRSFGLAVDFDELEEFSRQFEGVRARLESAVTEAVETGAPVPGKPAATPPTGLPAWSTPSADPEIPPASGGYSGASLSSGPCNTTMPPASTTAAPAAGASTAPDPGEIDPMPATNS